MGVLAGGVVAGVAGSLTANPLTLLPPATSRLAWRWSTRCGANSGEKPESTSRAQSPNRSDKENEGSGPKPGASVTSLLGGEQPERQDSNTDFLLIVESL